MDDRARSEVEALLLAHPDVAGALLVHEEAADGRAYPIAYVVPDAERMREARAHIELADRTKRVARWRRAFDQVYGSEMGDAAPSFVGWTNSYTGRSLPEPEMREWLDATVERILSLRPARLLEIGCGVGLLVQALAPACEAYRGTDLSPIAIARLRRFAAGRPELAHVELFEREASDLRDQAPVSVDTVVLNSVIQYFPDLGYLRRVIAEAARVTGSGGRIFIGDVRHFGLLAPFHGAVQLAKAPAGASVSWLKRRVALAVEQDRELAIDPEFFLRLPGSEPRISGAEVMLKRGTARNELTRYRYDVVLHVERPEHLAPRAEAEWQGDWAGDGHAIADAASRVEAGRLASACIGSVPNRRLCADLAVLRRLRSADDRQSVEQVRAALATEAETGRDPEEFWALADRGACDVCLSWTPGADDGRFDVSIAAPGEGRPAPASSPTPGDVPFPPRRLATDPLEVAFKQQLALELQQMLSERLPDASWPAAVLAVDVLPAGEPASRLPGLGGSRGGMVPMIGEARPC